MPCLNDCVLPVQLLCCRQNGGMCLMSFCCMKVTNSSDANGRSLSEKKYISTGRPCVAKNFCKALMSAAVLVVLDI